MTHHSHGLSVCIIARSSVLWRWQLNVIQHLQAQQLIRIERVISLHQPPARVPFGVSALHRLDALTYRSPIQAFESVDLAILGRVEVLPERQISQPEQGECSDFVLDLTELNRAEALLPLAKRGVLRAVFSGQSAQESWGLGLQAYSQSTGQTCLAVYLVSCDSEAVVLSQARPSLDHGSYTRNLNYYWALMNQLWARVFKLMSDNDGFPDVSIASADSRLRANASVDEVLVVNRIGPSLQAMPMRGAYCRFGTQLLSKLRQKFLTQEQWRLLVRFNPADNSHKNFTQGLPLAFDEYQELIPPDDCFWADPFIITHAGQHFVFFEELPFATERGHLCCMEVFEDGTHSEPVSILKQDYHLSYPNVFEYESAFYMIPESGENGTIDLYCCTDFPYQWVFSHTLISGMTAYDATLLEYQGRWWLFATIAIEAGFSGCEELHLFYADSPLSKNWIPHRQNPVISDASKARPAGQFFSHNGQLYRPSQDCAGSYGAGLNINRILQLTTETYQEVTEQRCRPNWDPELIALHTLNINSHLAVADALRKHSRYRA